MKIEWEELPNDGADFKCSLSTFITDVWNCPQKANKAIPGDDFGFVQAALPRNITLSGRAVCMIHQTMLERDFK